MEPTLGEIKEFAFDREPENFMLCDGRLLPVIGNEPLFNLIGYKYGGEEDHFAIPFKHIRAGGIYLDTLKFICVKGNYPVFN